MTKPLLLAPAKPVKPHPPAWGNYTDFLATRWPSLRCLLPTTTPSCLPLPNSPNKRQPVARNCVHCCCPFKEKKGVFASGGIKHSLLPLIASCLGVGLGKEEMIAAGKRGAYCAPTHCQIISRSRSLVSGGWQMQVTEWRGRQNWTVSKHRGAQGRAQNPAPASLLPGTL